MSSKKHAVSKMSNDAIPSDVDMSELLRIHEKRIATLMASPERKLVKWLYSLGHAVTGGKIAKLQTRDEYLTKAWARAGKTTSDKPAGKAVRGDDMKKINAFFNKGKAGFHDAAIRELERFTFSVNADNSVRANAAFKIALLALGSKSPEYLAVALENLRRFDLSKLPNDLQNACAISELKLLEALGSDEAFGLVVDRVRKGSANMDLLLLGSNFFADGQRLNDNIREDWINKAVRSSGLREKVGRLDPFAPLTLDNIGLITKMHPVTEGPLVSVIMPVFNNRDYVATSVKSILGQSWQNLELIVVDDCSNDGTIDILNALAKTDPRMTVLSTGKNSGPYVARNIGLLKAEGEFVTCQDGDDWSHPARLARQVAHLLKNRKVMANTSLWARATSDLRFATREQSTSVVHLNSSSLMFRRETVIEKIGYWDSVRFGGDTEFIKRLQAAFGTQAYVELDAMLAISRLHSTSITRSKGSEYLGAKTGARNAYWNGYETWHTAAKENGQDLYVPFPIEKRPFGVPALLTPGATGEERHYDVIILSDFRHLGGNTASNLQELTVQTAANISTAIVQVDRFDFNVSRPIHPDVQALVDSGAVDVLVAGEKATCGLATIRFPAVFQEPQPNLPTISARHVRVIVNQPPRRVEGEPPFYSIESCKKHITDVLGTPGDWVPIGPAVRNALKADNQQDHLTSEDWFNIVAIQDETVTSVEWADSVPVIGRHGRDNFEKWPTDVNVLKSAYPLSGDFKVKILGGASYPIAMLGEEPKNWIVYPFNSVDVEEFLKSIDFFVFFPHEGRIEAFGRTIIEAIAASKLVILPRVFSDLFGDAAIYCEASDVASVVSKYYQDKGLYIAQVNKAKAIVSQRFGYDIHVARVKNILSMPQSA